MVVQRCQKVSYVRSFHCQERSDKDWLAIPSIGQDLLACLRCCLCLCVGICPLAEAFQELLLVCTAFAMSKSHLQLLTIVPTIRYAGAPDA